MGRPDRRGFTLVEVMAAVVIFSIAIAAVFATFQFQQASYTVQSRVGETQKNAREGMEMLARDIRLAGYGIPAAISIPAGTIPGLTAIKSLSPVDNSTGPDSIYIIYLYDMDANQPPTTITAAMPMSSAELNVASVAGFANGDLVIIADGARADLLEVTQVQDVALKLQHNSGGAARNYNDPGGWRTFGPYATGATLAKARFVRYYIDPAGYVDNNGVSHPTLMVDRMGGGTPQPLADDIEDMQFQFLLDTNGDGIVDTTVDNPTAAQVAQIRQVRIMLCARTAGPEKGWSEAPPALANHAGGGSADGYRRRVLDMLVDVRNSGL